MMNIRIRPDALVVATATLLATLAVRPAGANHDVPLLPDVFPKIRTILSPLASQPAIVEDGTSLRIELDPEIVGATVPTDLSASLKPSFGAAVKPVALDPLTNEAEVASKLWPGRAVHAATFSVPPLDDFFVEDLYDLTISFGEETDVQHRAVKVVAEFPKEPTFVILADPSVGDPRPVQEGAEDLVNTGSPDSLIEKTLKTVGNPMNDDRWAALGKAIDEINLLQPDFVLVTGDLTFALYPRPANVEYEDAFRILSRLRVPTYLSPGNHDLYSLEYDDVDRPQFTDGKELWPMYFGPLYYSTEFGPNLHLVSLNTFDWSSNEREPFDENDEFSTRAGGQIDDVQLEWLRADLTSHRTSNPSGEIITFAHHDPSWIRARHPWPGKNRLETRHLLADLNVGVHFAGHSHEDRVARYHEGNIVETNGRGGPHGELHYLLPDNSRDTSWSQEDLGAIVRDPSYGPLFVTTTSVSSVLKGPDWGLGSYWGYRYGILRDNGDSYGFDPIDFGYPATREFLDERAERPENWNPAHSVFGVFSYPSYLLNVTTEGPNDGSEPFTSVTITNGLLVDVEVELLLSVSGDSAMAFGGVVEWIRSTGGRTDVRVRATVPAGGEVRLTAART